MVKPQSIQSGKTTCLCSLRDVGFGDLGEDPKVIHRAVHKVEREWILVCRMYPVSLRIGYERVVSINQH